MNDPHSSDALSIAIVGVAGRFPGAGDVAAFWRNLRDGVESITFFDDGELDPSVLAAAKAGDPGFVKAAAVMDGEDLFDAGFFDFNPREAEITDPQQRVLLECAWQALENAGVDPESFDGAIGVFAGVGLNGYFLNNVLGHPEIFRTTPTLQIMIGADKDYVAPRLSYKLDLKGPSVSVQTACSTSLVAVHLACQSLQDYQCDLALAGGCSIRVPQRSGYWYQEGGIFSPDGRCRPFDAAAGGTVSGSGAGVVVLKRLEDALLDGDRVLAVVRGSAINNDGTAKVGFTAPSVEGQVAVISEALAAAGVDSRSIGYVEAHGTATHLGDPIEVSALAQAFAGEDGGGTAAGTCVLGSVKSNVGHLDTAAGVTGLIKTVLALRHRQIPPTLHFQTPHPGIDFDGTPFRVGAELAAWPPPAGGGPRRAGVSSFGIGGSNAHAVLEEAPADEPSGPSRDWQLVLLSARSATALETVTDELARHLEEHPEDDLADVAHTRQVGRKRFEHRRCAVCRDRDDALAVLRDRDAERISTLVRESKDRPVAFLLSGQGAQYPGMGRGLYDGEPTFREHVDAAAEILAPTLGFDLRQVLYPPPGHDPEAAARRLEDTAVAQPALFVVEHALASLWMEWGVTPRALLGHSIGEYVAACLAGVLSFEDALALVAARGRLMRSLPPGAMLSVPLSGLDVAQLVGDELSLAAINGPTFHVLSGTEAAVAAAAEELAGRGVDCRRLRTSHAFHSAMMDPILDDFAAEVSKVPLAAPGIPFLSNLTGTWITGDQATDPGYWVHHLRQTVRFGDGLAELLKEPEQVLLEVGPGRTLATFARRHDRRAREQTVLTSIRHPSDGEPDQAFLLATLGRLWLDGVRIDWHGFARHERRRRVELPGYPFERRRYWLEAAPRSAAAPIPGQPAATSPAAVATADAARAAAPGAVPAPAGGHPRPDLATDYAAPRSDTERALAAIWGEALSLAEVGVFDDFFELGGHSLLATQIGRRVREVLRADVTLGDLFEKPTVAGMAARVDESLAAGGGEAPAALPAVVPQPAERHRPFPLTDVQQAYWIGRNAGFELGGVATHVYNEAEVRGIDLEAVSRAWRRLIDHHEMLRAVVRPDGRQEILERVPPYEIEVLDLRHTAPGEAAEALDEVRRQMSQQVLPADHWPLFEIRASRLEDDLHRLHVSFDLLIGDAWSWQLLMRQFQQLYRDPDAELAPLALSFRDYVVAVEGLETSPAFERDLDYWRGRLADFPAAPELPLAVRPSALEKPRFSRLAKVMDRRRWRRLKERATLAGLTSSGILLAAFAEVLGCWSKSPRFAINLTLFNRLPLHPEVNELVGDFTSLTLLAVDGSAAGTFLDRARRLQKQLWEDLDHRLVSAVRVLRELARAHGTPARAMMPVVFTSTLNMAPPDAGGEAEEAGAAGDEGYGISQTPQVWIDHQVTEIRGALHYNWDVVEDLFPPGLLDEMFAAYGRLIERLADLDEAWQEELPRLVPQAQIAAREAVNATSGPIADTLLHLRFAERARVQASRPAVICDDRTLSYDELARRSHALAVRLRELGVRPDRLVAVALRKGWEQVVAVLAVLEAGGAYLPVDPQLPDRRRCYLIENGEVEIVLTQSGLLAELAWPPGLELLAVDEIEPAAGELEVLEPLQQASDLAYVIFTSGSTGDPKGVMIDHRGAGNTVDDVNQRFGVGPEDRVLAVSALHFDLSVYDVFGILAAGGAIVLPPSDGDRDPALWSRQMLAHGVTIWNSVPALMELLVDFADGDAAALPEGLRLVMLSGDWIPVPLPDRIRELRPAARVVSLGGATEASIWSILHPVDGTSQEEATPGGASIPYGKPMRNQSFQVLDHRLEPRPVWVPGQLFIGGAGLARGYWRDPEKTARSFPRHPRTGERLYRTGDLGRYLPDGSIEFLGREDFQVKVRGYRIELGEIEAALARHPGVRETVVTVHRGGGGEQQLAAYLIAVASPPPADELKAHLRELLPAYMVPAFFVPLAAWPLTANGKVDRGALPPPGEAGGEPAQKYVAPETETEEILAEICAAILGKERIGIHDDFFELGGDSLTATRLIFQIRKEFEIELPIRSFFDAPTVAQLAERIEETILAEIEELPDEEVRELL